MAKGSSNLIVSKQDFLDRVIQLEEKMQRLYDVIQRYEDAKKNLDQFIESGDTNYEDMIESINANISAAKKAWTSLQETKQGLEKTIDQMDSMSLRIKETISSATSATKQVVEAALKVNSVL